MVNPLSWLKHRLSHIKEDSLHFKVTKSIWGHQAYGKACTYYWFKLPFALLGWCLLFPIGAVIAIVGGFSGFVITAFPSEEMKYCQKTNLFYPYKTLPNGRRLPAAPWEIAAVLGLVYLFYYLAAVNQNLGLWVVAGVLGVAAFGAFTYVISKGWQWPPVANARALLSQKWDKDWCPPLNVEADSPN